MTEGVEGFAFNKAIAKLYELTATLAKATGTASVLPRRVRITHTLNVKPDAVPPGETVRAWLPYPRAIAGQQEAIALVASQPARPQVAPEAALQRTAYLEQAEACEQALRR